MGFILVPPEAGFRIRFVTVWVVESPRSWRSGDRMRLRGTMCVAMTACILAGCHQPMVTPKLPSFQSREVTVRDWKIAADDVASELASLDLVPTQWRPQFAGGPQRPVFVQVAEPTSVFLREVVDELQAQILRRGGVIANNPAHATVVTLDVDIVRWTPGDLLWSSTEAVLKAAVEIDGRLVKRLTEPVYVRNGDVALYQPPRMGSLPGRLLRYETR